MTKTSGKPLLSSMGRVTVKLPVMDVKLVPAALVRANDYNPNFVASPEMRLLIESIEQDGVTQPIVVYHDGSGYIVVDGFHRFTVLTRHFKCDRIPVVVIDKDLSQRMASTIRHNRARGKHRVDLMSEMVVNLKKMGLSDVEIAKNLGMEAEEMLRLKQQSGIASAFADREFSRSWEQVDD